MAFGISSTTSIHLGADSHVEREHLFQWGIWSQKWLFWMTYVLTKEGSKGRKFTLKISPKEFLKWVKAPLFNPIIYTLGTVVWWFNYSMFGGSALKLGAVGFTVAAAYFWNQWWSSDEQAKNL